MILSIYLLCVNINFTYPLHNSETFIVSRKKCFKHFLIDTFLLAIFESTRLRDTKNDARKNPMKKNYPISTSLFVEGRGSEKSRPKKKKKKENEEIRYAKARRALLAHVHSRCTFRTHACHRGRREREGETLPDAVNFIGRIRGRTCRECS